MPDGTGRIVTSEELAQFAECRLAWWYDRTHPLAHANDAALSHRMELMGAVYGPSARDLPEYQLITHLRERATGRTAPAATDAPKAAVHPHEPPNRLIVGIILIAAVVIGCMMASIVFALTQR